MASTPFFTVSGASFYCIHGNNYFCYKNNINYNSATTGVQSQSPVSKELEPVVKKKHTKNPRIYYKHTIFRHGVKQITSGYTTSCCDNNKDRMDN